MLHVISTVLLLIAFGKYDPFRVRTPLRACAAGARGLGRQLLLSCTRFCFGDEELCGGIAIGIFRMVAHESDVSAVRRPCGRALVPLALGEPVKFLRGDVEDVDVCLTSLEQVALPILLEPVTIDNHG